MKLSFPFNVKSDLFATISFGYTSYSAIPISFILKFSNFYKLYEGSSPNGVSKIINFE